MVGIKLLHNRPNKTAPYSPSLVAMGLKSQKPKFNQVSNSRHYRRCDKENDTPETVYKNVRSCLEPHPQAGLPRLRISEKTNERQPQGPCI